MSYSSSVKTEFETDQRQKYFTLAEATRALPLVKRIVRDIYRTHAQRMRVHRDLSACFSQMSHAKQDSLQNEFDRATDRLGELLDELQLIGVELKDPSRGLLDFPCMHEGREVLLCWKADEESITHWHELEGGIAGRKPVALLH